MCIGGSPKSVTPPAPAPVPPPPPAEETPKVMQPAVEKTADKKKQMQGRSALKVDLQSGGGASGRSGLMIPT